MLDRLTKRSLLALVLVIATSNWLFAASPVIGVAMAKGGFRVNDTAVTGNATLFQGAVLETVKASSSIRMESGATVNLAGSSRGTLYQDRLVLERGAGELSGNYRFEALGLTIEPGISTGTARIAIGTGKSVQVAALSGSYRVRSSSGFLVGVVEAGRSLEFEPQAGAGAPSTITGCVTKSDGKFFLTDDVAGVKVQLLGSKLDPETGNRVEIIGTALGNSQVQVNTLKRVSRGCSAPAAAAAAGAGAAKAGTAAKTAGDAGMSAGTKAVIAGVAVAAAGGTAAGVYSATREDAPPSSR